MNVIIPSMFLIVLGAVIFVVGPKTAKPGAAGQTKLARIGAMIAGLVLMVSSGVTVIGVGEVGVKHFLGNIDMTPLAQGLHVINPLASSRRLGEKISLIDFVATASRTPLRTAFNTIALLISFSVPSL